MDKRFMVDQLSARIRETVEVARREGAAAAVEAREGASPDEKRADGRVALENANLARAQNKRAERAQDELLALDGFVPQKLAGSAKVALGAVIEVEDGNEGRTLFLAPAGAGIELTFPDGDGFLTVVTPVSPLGRAVIGRKVGDTVEIVVQGEPREWTVTFVG